MAPPVNRVIMIVIALMVIAVIIPLAIGMIAVMDLAVITYPNGSTGVLKDVADPAVIILLTVLLPILAVIGLIMYFLPSRTD
ncbi:His1-like major capsid protein [Lokiarchaeota virus WyrdV1]|nr:His1-like major capsid protein [Lokiarchaeota virus WyrdV1]